MPIAKSNRFCGIFVSNWGRIPIAISISHCLDRFLIREHSRRLCFHMIWFFFFRLLSYIYEYTLLLLMNSTISKVYWNLMCFAWIFGGFCVCVHAICLIKSLLYLYLQSVASSYQNASNEVFVRWIQIVWWVMGLLLKIAAPQTFNIFFNKAHKRKNQKPG